MEQTCTLLEWHDPPGSGGRIRLELGEDPAPHLREMGAGASADRPFIADIRHANGRTLSIGLGGPCSEAGASAEPNLSVLCFMGPGGEPPYFVSVGHLALKGTFVWFYGGHWTEFQGRNVLPLHLAVQAVTEFVRTGQLPKCVPWEET